MWLFWLLYGKCLYLSLFFSVVVVVCLQMMNDFKPDVTVAHWEMVCHFLYRVFAPKCASCNQPILPAQVNHNTVKQET